VLAIGAAIDPAQGPVRMPVHHQSGYRDRYIAANGARLYVADWGGNGPPLLFMPGFGNGAHIFDSLAPAFTDHFHVVALTPRGFPPSSAPDSGYTIAQLAADVRVVLDSLGGGKAVLAGHSISGAVITRFAIDYPDRLLAAVYLDAAFDFGAAYRRSHEPRPIRGPPEAADTTAPHYRAWRARYPDWDSVRERDSQMWQIDSADIARRQRLVTALANEVRSTPHPIWQVQAPALVVCGIGSVERAFGWLTPDSSRWHLAVTEAKRLVARSRALCEDEAHKVPRGQALMLDAGHYVFLDQREAVVSAMKQFLEGVGTRRVAH
jgi:pimeloyl-ACP methyl ester carboxylesterase